jgi:DNA-binding CsgD family transcriptional regulator
MVKPVDLERTRIHLELALEVIEHDRWVLGGVRDGRLRVIAQSIKHEHSAGHDAADAQDAADAAGAAGVRPLFIELSQMARRCLYERHPLAVTSIVEPGAEDGDWEMDWPALVYAPVGLPQTRPVGILIVGCRREHWYTQEEIDYVAALGVTLTAPVSCAAGPLGRLSPRERQVALLIAEGLSDGEIARAIDLAPPAAARIVDLVLRKLAVRTRREVRDLVPALAAATRPHLV